MALAGKSPLLQGTLDRIVLQLLQAAPTNGYELTLRIQAVSKDVLSVNAGSLYPALYRLEARGLIRAEWQSTENGRRAKVYSLTAAGRKRLAAERESWQRFSGALAEARREFGIRMALGATPRLVYSMIFTNGFRLGSAGVGIGVVVALGVTGAIRALLFGVAAVYWTVYALVAAVVLTLSVLATIGPALRARATNPSVVMRQE